MTESTRSRSEESSASHGGRWRSLLGMVLILLPLLAVMGMGATGVLLGSMGMDIHFKSKLWLCEAISMFLLWCLGSVFIGAKMLRAGKLRE